VKKLLIVLAALLLVTAAYAADAPKGNAPSLVSTDLVGRAAPAFELQDYAGETHKLSDYKGKIVVLDWFNYGCPVVKAYYTKKPFVDAMNTALLNQKDVVWLSVNSSAPGSEGGDPDELKSAAGSFGKKNLVLADPTGKVGHAYGSTATPTVYVVDHKGKVIYAGAFDEADSPKDAPKGTNLAIAAVKAARAGKAPAVTSKKPFGCSVKYAD
jgi:peroxiredoxin